MIPRPLKRLIDSFNKLPGIGPKTAQRLAFYVLRMPVDEVNDFAENLKNAKSGTIMCSFCRNIDEVDPCSLCTDITREKNVLAVVATPLDLLSMEKAGFKGLYHVLHGLIDPLNGVGPEELFIDSLIERVGNFFKFGSLNAPKQDINKSKNDDLLNLPLGGIKDHEIEEPSKEAKEEINKFGEDGFLEVILALSASLEGESTSVYIQRLLKNNFSHENIKITKLARGLPVGGDVEYADEITLSKALEGRVEI